MKSLRMVRGKLGSSAVKLKERKSTKRRRIGEGVEPRSFRKRVGPEALIQEAWIEWFEARKWIVKVMHGNMYQSGVPDLYIAHKLYRARWVEIKNTEGSYQLEESQVRFFTLLSSVDIGVWVLGPVCEDEYKKLWLPSNWHAYLPAWKIPGRRRRRKTT